jgi:hypothetical protein
MAGVGPSTRFEVACEEYEEYRRFGAFTRSLTVRLLPPRIAGDSLSHFMKSIRDVALYGMRDCADSDMVGVTLRNMNSTLVSGISFRRRDRVTDEVIVSAISKVSQSNSCTNALDRLVVEVCCVRLPLGYGGGEKRKGRPLSVMSHLKKSVVVVTAAENCLAHALVIAKARLTDDPDYKAYRQGRKIGPVVEELLRVTGIDLTDGGGIPELRRFQEHFEEFRIVV